MTTERQRRVAIGDYYVNVLEAPPIASWTGKGGTISQIMAKLNLPKGSNRVVHRVLKVVEQCADDRVVYDGQRAFGSGGQTKLIRLGSVESQLVADFMENGSGHLQTTNAVNEYRARQGLVHVGRSAVYSAYKRVSPNASALRQRKQGSTDEDGVWAKARLQWVTQLAIRIGIRRWDDASEQECPAYFDIDRLGSLDLCQIVWWYEHKKCHIGAQAPGHRTEVRFPRDEHGRPDATGTLREPRSVMKTKYTKEARLSLGCAKVMLPDGSVEGRRCDPFMYSGQWIRTIKEWSKMQDGEIERVRKLTGNTAPWVTVTELPRMVFSKMTVFNGVGTSLKTKMNDVGIHTMGDLKHLSIDELEFLQIQSITKQHLKSLHATAQAATSGQ